MTNPPTLYKMEKMRQPSGIFVLVISAFSLMSCTQSERFEGPQATKGQRDVASQALFDCASTNWRRFDDNISPAPIVAKALAAACSTQIRNLAKVDSMGLPASWETSLYDKLMTGDALQSLVLASRAEAQRGRR